MKRLVRYPINANSNTRVKKALFGDITGKIKTFAILSPENPMGMKISSAENNKRIKQLKQYLKEMNIQYIPIEGSYGSIEHSFLLINLALSDAEFLAKKFEQESFFYGKTTEVDVESDDRHTASTFGYYEISDGKTYRLLEESNKIENMQDAEDFFSRHGDYKWSIIMDIFSSTYDNLKEITSDSDMDKCLQENRTLHSRMKHRAYAYHTK